MVIIVTGTPATGKTTFAKRLAQEKGYKYLDLTVFIKEKGLYEGNDTERDSLIVDEDKLIEALLPKLAAHPETVGFDRLRFLSLTVRY